MLSLKAYNPKAKLPEADYVLDGLDKFLDLAGILTPKFVGKWEILSIEPTIKEVKGIEAVGVADWINLTCYVGKKKIEVLALDNPKLIPKEQTRKEKFDEIVATLHHVLETNAYKELLHATMPMDELESILHKLDNDCVEDTENITLKKLQSQVQMQRIVYASDVLKAFLLREKYRWNLYEKLVHNIGLSYAYNALYSYVKKLLKNKTKYLNNEDVKDFLVKRVDAPFVCYVYTLFASSNSYKQLPIIMLSIDDRSKQSYDIFIKEELC